MSVTRRIMNDLTRFQRPVGWLCLLAIGVQCLHGTDCMGQTAPSAPPASNPSQPPTNRYQPTPALFGSNPLAPSARLVSQPKLDSSPQSTLPPAEEFDEARPIAVVGDQHVLAGDMMVFIEPTLAQIRGKVPPQQEREYRDMYIRQALKQYVIIKALYQEFFRDMAGNKPPKDVEDLRKKITTKASQLFYERQVPSMLERYKVNSMVELETKLREQSNSLSATQAQFIERIFSNEIERKYVPEEYEFSRDELYADYVANTEKWNVPGRVRWRELCVRFNKHDRETARKMIDGMFHEVVYGGKPFAAVARDSSEGYTASNGGLHDWTTEGSLKSKAIENAIFHIPLQALSGVIEDDIGYHLVEVLEREERHIKTFDMAQAEIREKLNEARRQKNLEEFHAKVMSRTSIWTLWPEDIPGSRPLREALGD